MANVVGEVAINVTADIGPLIRETARAKSVLGGLEGAAQRMGAGLGRVASVTGRVGAKMSILTAVLAGAAGAALALTTNAAAMGDAIGDNAKAAGMGTSAFQEYRFAIKEAADMTDEDFASAMVKLNKSLGEAREGSKSAIAAFEKIGISQASIADGSVDTEAALAAFVKKMEETTDPATAAAMAADLFGKSGASIGAALSGVPGQVGALVERARELGVVMGPKAVEAAGKFDAKMKELGAQFEATKMKIAEVLLPVLVDKLIPFLQDTVIPAINSVISAIGEWVTEFDKLDPAIQTVITVFGAAFGVGGPVLLLISGVATALSLLFAGPAAPLVLLGVAIIAAAALWPGFGEKAKSAFVILGGSVVGAIELIGELIKAVGAAEQGFLDMAVAFMKATGISAGPEAIGAVNDSVRQNAIDLGYYDPSGGRDRQGTVFPPGGGLPDAGSGGGGLSGVGTGMADGLVDGFVNRMAERQPEIGAALNAVTTTAQDVFETHSPSLVFQRIGEFIGQGLANGISSSQGIVVNAVKSMGEDAVAANDAMTNDILAGLNTLFAGSKEVGAGLALVSTLIGAAKEIEKGIFGFAQAAMVIAKGMAFMKAIRGAKKGGGNVTGGGGGGGVGSGGGGGGAAAAQNAGTYMNFSFTGGWASQESMGRFMVASINQAVESGAVIRGARIT